MAFSAILSISLFVCCVLVKAADVSVFLSVDKTDVPLGETVNITCQFGVNKADFKDAQFSDNGNAFFTFDSSTSGEQEGVKSYGALLVDDVATTNSSIWVTVKASLCGADKEKERTYECKANSQSESGTDSEKVTFSGDASTETCDKPAAGGSNSTDSATTEEATTVSGNNNGTSTEDNKNIGLYGSAIALIIILVTAAILGLIGLWYLYLVKQGRASP